MHFSHENSYVGIFTPPSVKNNVTVDSDNLTQTLILKVAKFGYFIYMKSKNSSSEFSEDSVLHDVGNKNFCYPIRIVS